MSSSDFLSLYEEGDTLVYISYDGDPQNPRRDWENPSTLWCWHSRYNLGDKDRPAEPVTIEELLEDPDVLACGRLVLYDHSGLSVRLVEGEGMVRRDWDSGVVGVAFVSRSKMIEQGFTEEALTRERAMQILEGDVETYDGYLRGHVYEYAVRVGGGDLTHESGGYMGKDAVHAMLHDALGAERVARAKEVPKKDEGAALKRTRGVYERAPREVTVRLPDWDHPGVYLFREFGSIAAAREFLDAWDETRMWQDGMIVVEEKKE